jgi:protein-disulfide isomerase
MARAKYSEVIWNAATAVVTILAVITGTLRLRAEFLDRTAAPPAVRTRMVSNWRDFSTAGTRMGPANTAVTILEFSDFQCPFCRVASGDLRDLRHRYPDDVSVVYRHFPIHTHAREAAIAAECADRVGSFEAFHDRLFAQPDSIGAKRWTRFAAEAGILDTAQFARCLNTRSAAYQVHQDSVAAVALGVQGTPTFLINDLMVIGNPGFEQLSEYVKAALRRNDGTRAQ